MALDDFFESEVAVAVAATAALFSPRVRGTLRQGAVYGLAGVLTAGDAVGTFVRGVGRGVQRAAPATAEDAADALAAMAKGADGEAPAPAERRTRRTRTEPEPAEGVAE